MNSKQWERAHKIAQDIHAADLAWTAALDAKINALKINNKADVQAAEEVILTESLRLAQYGVTLATIVLELNLPSPLGIADKGFQSAPDYLTSTEALEDMASESFWEHNNHQATQDAMSISAEDEEWAAYNAAHRIDAYPNAHPGFKRLQQSIQQYPPLGAPEQDEALPSDVLGDTFTNDYAEWFFESGEFPAISGDEGIAS